MSLHTVYIHYSCSHSLQLQNIPHNPEVPGCYPVDPYPPVPTYGYSEYPPGPPQIVVVQEPAVTTPQRPQEQVTVKLYSGTYTTDTLGTKTFPLITKVSLF